MLQIKYIDDKTILFPLYKALLTPQKIRGVNVVLYDGEKPIGLCNIDLSDVVKIKNLLLLPEYDNSPNFEFFARSVLFKLSKIGCNIVKVGFDERYIKYGFEKSGDDMKINANDIKFPSDCHN